MSVVFSYFVYKPSQDICHVLVQGTVGVPVLQSRDWFLYL